ncbi:hypothetical protein EMIHUDRAFT_369316, partial [Emiliania huxleyi CCMP1516]|uniref:PRA1 family protein n=2 Tax=Emiliania huxleyi TaxID=2903 RepID=A0A0D3J8M0_EMIH1
AVPNVWPSNASAALLRCLGYDRERRELLVDRLLARALPADEWWTPSACWTVSYAASIGLRLRSHEVLVFGAHPDRASSCARVYAKTYAALLFSTGLNLALVGGLALSHELALVLTASLTVCWSYHALTLSWGRSLGSPDGRYSYTAVEASSPPRTSSPQSACAPPPPPPPQSAPLSFLGGSAGGRIMRELLAGPGRL